MIRLDADRPPANPDARWRAEYRQRQYDARISAVQPDLFGAPPTEQFKPNPSPSIARKTRYFAARPDLSNEERAVMIASAANWLRVSQRVRIKANAHSRYAGRKGVVWRLCSPVFADHTYVNLDLIGREQSEKIAFVELRDVEPIES